MNLRMQTKFFVVGVLAIVSITGTQVEAAKVAKPDTPIIVKISPTTGTGKYRTLKVQIERQPAGVVTTVISNQRIKCTIKSKGTSCLLPKVVAYTFTTVIIHAVSARGSAKSVHTPYITVRPTSTWINEAYDINGVRFPASVNGQDKGKVLGTASKWSKIQPLKRSGVTSAGLHQAKPVVAGVDVVFQLSGAVAFALSSASGSCGTNSVGQSGCAVAVAADGTNPSLFAAGSATPAVRDFFSAPNGKFYVVFMTSTILSSGGQTCVLASVNLDTGVPTCVDNAMTSITVAMGYSFGAFVNGNPALQFDDAGNLYYAGMTTGGSTFTLRRNANGAITTLVNDNISVRDFVVLGDGSVLLAGSTSSTQAQWFRKIAPSGAITNLVTGNQPTFMRKFVDGNVYFGSQGTGLSPTVNRYLVSEDKVDSIAWMSGGSMVANTPPSRNDLGGLCPPVPGTISMFCSASGSMVRSTFNLGSTATYAVVGGYSGQASELMQYYPVVARENSSVKQITIAYQVNSKIVLAGLDANNKNVITIYDPSTHTETVVFDGTNEVEVYSMGYVASTGKLMFNGLKFSTGQVVVGDIVVS